VERFNEPVINPQSAYNLIVLFNTSDCPVCLNEIAAFNELSNIDQANLTVLGILNTNSKEETNSFKDKNRIKFELIGNDKLFGTYSSGRTPEQLLVDVRHGNEIIYKSYRKKIASSQAATPDIINLIIRNQM